MRWPQAAMGRVAAALFGWKSLQSLPRGGILSRWSRSRRPRGRPSRKDRLGRVMMTDSTRHDAEHARAAARSPLQPPPRDLIRVGSRRWFLQTGLAGVAGVSLPGLLRANRTVPRK